MQFSKFLTITSVLGASMFAADAKLIRMQSIPESKIVSKVRAEYPADAADLRVHGIVKVKVVIGTDGHVESVRLVSGHPLLVPSAMQSVRHWVFEPTLVNDKPVRVATEIDVPFEAGIVEGGIVDRSVQTRRN